MKNFLQFLLILLFVGAASWTANGQDLHIYYNLYNDNITYVKGGKPVKNLKIRKGQEVQVHLTEFNPFTSNIDLKVEETTDDAGSGLMGAGGMSSIMGGMPGLGGLFTGTQGVLGQGGGLPIFDAPLMVLNDSVISFKNIKTKYFNV